jgi:predicted dehydrogenase
MANEIRVALVGIGGYGEVYLNPLLRESARYGAEFVAAIDPHPENCSLLAEIQAQGVPVFASLTAFYAAEKTADLVVISAPIHLHAPLSREAVAHGASVLCEKPLAATTKEAAEMAAAEAASGRFIAIGYQWSFSPTIQALKQDVMAGRFGRAKQLRTLVFWPRRKSYYQRSPWAGVKQTSTGQWVLDSPVNNATAHYLHNMLYLLGKTRETSAQPQQVQAELYRANPIENYDTAALRCQTKCGAEILIYTSHAVPTTVGPLSTYEFEHGTICNLTNDPKQFIAHMHDGTIIRYGQPDRTNCDKLWDTVEAIRTGTRPPCTVATATPHTICVNAAQESSPEITTFPDQMITVDKIGDQDSLTYVSDILPAFIQACDLGILPAEHGGIPWACPSPPVAV